MRLQHFILSSILFAFLATVTLFAQIEHWDTFSEEDVSSYKNRNDALPQLVVAREDSLKGKAINVYIDGEYLTSLLPGAYTIERICPGKHRIRLAYTNILTHYKEKEKGGQFFRFASGDKQFFKIVKTDKGLELKPLSVQQTKNIHHNYTKKQRHTISRISKRKCAKMAHKNNSAAQRK
jgi:OOP family OmpA-OmpF porin